MIPQFALLKNGRRSMTEYDVYYPLILTPFGKVPLIAATMTDEREREIAKKYPVKAESEASHECK